MGFDLDWNGDDVKAALREEAARNLERAAIVVKNRAKELLNVAGTGKVKGKKVGPVVRSKPGEPPRKQTGNLRMRVAHEVDRAKLTARVGTNVKYGMYLELGTKRGIRPRPWLHRALAESRDKILRILAGKGR